MSYIAKLRKAFPQSLDFNDIIGEVNEKMWKENPELATITILAVDNRFDVADYLARYPDIAASHFDPIEHFARHGVHENRFFRSIGNRTMIPDASRKPEPETRKQAMSVLRPALSHSYSIIVTLWKRTSYIREQYLAFMRQSIKPQEIIYIINNAEISPEQVRRATGENVKIVVSDINSVFSRFNLAYNAAGEFIGVVDDDTVPGEYWFANAIRACSDYDAYVVGSGRIYARKGIGGFFKTIEGRIATNSLERSTCNASDVWCDWGCNSYFFKREWLGDMFRDPRPAATLLNMEDMHSAINLYLHRGIPCVCPMQPAWDTRFHASLHPEYGDDQQAIWRTRGTHFSERKKYIEDRAAAGYVPVCSRQDLHRFHIIIPFGERSLLARCLTSLKAQVYSNYTCTLVDDCCDGKNAVNLITEMGLNKNRIRYLRNTSKGYALTSHIKATDTLQARPDDIILHLDGDDWLAHPHVLWQLNRIYCDPTIQSTYGNICAITSWKSRDFREYAHVEMSRRWSMAQDAPEAIIEPSRRRTREEVRNGWEYAPWGPTFRSFRYVQWLAHNRDTFTFPDGTWLKYAYDAAIMMPIWNSCGPDGVCYIPDPAYTYQKCGNTTDRKGRQDFLEAPASRRHIAQADKEADKAGLTDELNGNNRQAGATSVEVLFDNFDRVKQSRCHHNEAVRKQKQAIVTIVTYDYLAEAITTLQSWERNCLSDCATYIFISTRDIAVIKHVRSLLEKTGMMVVFPDDIRYPEAIGLEKKYTLGSDEYRWAMKSVLLAYLLAKGFDSALFIDPDIYAVSDITDIHNEIYLHEISIFPHFRNPDWEHTRAAMYKDGFYNGGMLGVTRQGEPHLERLTRRCLKATVKDPEHHLFVDQKYYDVFPMEVDNLFINKDRGINYNPVWNMDKTIGLVGHSQRSFLLTEGRFARVWHLSSSLTKGAIERYHPAVPARPVVAIYIFTKLLVILLLAIALWQRKADGITALNLWKRFNILEGELNKISLHINFHREHQLMHEVCSGGNINLDTLLIRWGDYVRDSICFDNLELFAELLLKFFPGNPTSEIIVHKMRRNDLRYITEGILANPDLSREEKDECLESESASQILANQLETLRAAAIDH